MWWDTNLPFNFEIMTILYAHSLAQEISSAVKQW